MTVSSQQLKSDLNLTLSDIMSRYENGEELNGFLYSGNTVIIDPDVLSVLQATEQQNTSHWDSFKTAPENTQGDGALWSFAKAFGYTFTENGAQSLGAGLNPITLNAELRITTVTQSIESSFKSFIDTASNTKIFVNKTTNKIVFSDTVLSATTHIPIDEMVVGAGKAIAKWAVYESFKGSIEAYYTGLQNGDPFMSEFRSELPKDTAAFVAGGAAFKMIKAGGLLYKSLASAGASTSTKWVLDQVEESLPQLIQDLSDAGQTQAQILDAALSHIEQKVNDYWGLTGNDADQALTQSDQFFTDISAALENMDFNAQNASHYDYEHNLYQASQTNFLEIDGRSVFYTEHAQIENDNIYGANTIRLDSYFISMIKASMSKSRLLVSTMH